jgi:glycosyltransferase involved in cell wall biosynthesis
MICSVIVPARDAAKTIGECILAVLSQSLPENEYELIVVDDGSSDRTGAIARRLGARVIARPPRGIAAARNAGVQAARADIVVFLDPDCLPKIDWLAQMIRPFDDPAVVGVQGAYASDQTELMPRLIQAEWEETYRQLESYPLTDVVRGFSAAFRRSVLLGADGFDASFAVGDDLELSYRLAKSGRRLVFNRRARVYHKHGDSVGRYFERSLRDGLWRSLIHARHPDKAAGDSQTSWALRAEIPLAGLTLASFLLGTHWRRFLPVAGVFAALFTSIVAPSAWRARKSGAEVALTIPGLHFVRSLALGSGMAIGRGTIVGQRVADRLTRLTRLFRRD